MSKPAVFPYGIVLREGGTVDTFPIVEVRFEVGENEEVSLFLLLDSGAALSALPRSDAALFGIDVERGALMHIAGVSGKPVKGWRHRLKARLAGEVVNLPVVFLDDVEAPRVLGRADVFVKFTIILEEHKRRSVFLKSGSKEAQILQGLVDSFR